MRVPELKAFERERGLRGYSRLRKAEIIELIRNSQKNTIPLQTVDQGLASRAPDRGPQAPVSNRGSQATVSLRPTRPPKPKKTSTTSTSRSRPICSQESG